MAKHENRKKKTIIIFTIPNMFTYLRIFLILVLMISFLDYPSWPEQLRFAIFFVAAASDFIDGYVARLWSLQSAVGRIMDPIADKLLVCCCLLLLASVGAVDSWTLIPATIIICREIIISNFRALLAENDHMLQTNHIAKYKTTTQLVAIGLLMSGDFGRTLVPSIDSIAQLLLWISALLTVYTAYVYLQSNAEKLSES